jgi:hypothetical protein
MRQTRLSSDDCFDNYVFHLLHELLSVSTLVFQNFQDSTEGPFMTFISIFIISLLVILTVLIECIISQVHINVVHVLFSGPLILSCAEASEGHLVQVYTQWGNTV